MSLLTASNLQKGFGAQAVLDDISLRVARGEKIGIVGKNGGGKTTLLKILLGLETPDRGSVHVARGIRIGYLSQISTLDETRTVREEAQTALAALYDAENELRETESLLAENPEDEEALEAYAAARDRFDFAGGDRAEQNLWGAVSAMGFSDTDLDKPVAVLSGGERTRLSMAKLLASAPDVLALDEPTNHLDIRAVEWLEGFLTRFPGAVLVVSHDRRFLENVVETIWEIEARHLTRYTGGFTSYREQRAAARARQLEEYQRQQEEIARTEEFIRRNIAGQNSKNAKGRLKQLNRLERIERPVDEPAKMKARVETSGRSGRETVVCERASKRYGDKLILDNANFVIERGAKVGVVGPNGAGKTTLIEMIVGDEEPDSGYLRAGFGVTIAYARQEADDFDPELSVLENFYEQAGMTVGEARGHLAKFLFTGDDVYKPVSALSGGERSKLAMALMVLSPANLLILDEPTNHLDVFSCDALTESLQRYSGTLLVVSHDRALLDAVTDKTLALEGGSGKVALFDGPYQAWKKAQDSAAPKAGSSATSASSTNSTNGSGKKSTAAVAPVPEAPAVNAHALSKERQKAAKRVAALEAEIEQCEARLAEIEAALSAPASADDALALSHAYQEAQDSLNAKMEEWETATLEAESLGAAV
ncbi:MAG: ABC-F family ATP-binding cassette domain-containing protein [Armatimonadaceae bacterium]